MDVLKKSETGTIAKAILGKFIRNPDHFRVNKVTDTSVKVLIESMRHGKVCHPLTVYAEGGKFVIAEGDQRYLAAKALKWKTIPYQVVEKRDSLLIALRLNLHRKNLTHLERAEAFKKVMNFYGMNQKALAATIGMTDNGISTVFCVLKLPDGIREQLRTEGKEIPLRHLANLSRIQDAEAQAQKFTELLGRYKPDDMLDDDGQNTEVGVESTEGADSAADEVELPTQVSGSKGTSNPGGRNSPIQVAVNFLGKAEEKIKGIYDFQGAPKGNNHQPKPLTVSEKNAIREAHAALTKTLERTIGLEKEPEPEAKNGEADTQDQIPSDMTIPIASGEEAVMAEHSPSALDDSVENEPDEAALSGQEALNPQGEIPSFEAAQTA